VAEENAGLAALEARVAALDGRGYKAYKALAGEYDVGDMRLRIDHVQGDPFAEPSRARAFVPPASAGLPAWALRGDVRRLATADFLNRRLADALRDAAPRVGSGRSGELQALVPGQEVLRRSALHVAESGALEARFRVGLPARGRTILGREAVRLLVEVVPAALRRALLFENVDPHALRRHVETVEDARALRSQLAERGLVAFVADGAHLPRRSGVDERPLDASVAVPFRAPPELRVVLSAPNAGEVVGMGIPEGITVIVGGGYHGKSTLLRALQLGVYEHIPGDGRERVVARADAVKVRAEDGRSVAGTDISNFIGDLPGGARTARFVTANASGSTSQAASIVEALEAGCRLLLLDEDTSATNFMIRDARMQALVPAEAEPITPYIDRVRQLWVELGVSTVLVAGGSGDYFDVADTVIALRSFQPTDVTARARAIARARPTGRRGEAPAWRALRARRPATGTIDPSSGRRDVELKAWTLDRLGFGVEEVRLGAVEQLTEVAQTRALAHALAWIAAELVDGQRTVADILDAAERACREHGLDTFQPYPAGELAEFRRYELAALLSRLRGLETR
jgi:predicted ABC-class ATPase